VLSHSSYGDATREVVYYGNVNSGICFDASA